MAKRKKRKQPKPDFSFTLEQNADDSLQHGVDHFLLSKVTPRDLKATIIHVFHAIELFMKAALARIHPTLIYSRFDDGPIRDNAHTVGFEKLVWRLQNFGIALSEADLEHLKALQDLRNSIEHHKVVGYRRAVERYIAEAIAFLDSFLPRTLDSELKERLDSGSYVEIRERIYSYDQRRRLAVESLERQLESESFSWESDRVVRCPECSEELFWVDDPNAAPDCGRCYFCDAEQYVTHCNRCESPILGDQPWSEENDPGICDSCWDDVMEGD